MATYFRGHAPKVTASSTLTSSASSSAYNNAYRKLATSQSSCVEVTLDVGEFCTGCAQTTRRLTVDGRLQRCSKHGNDSLTAQRSLDELAQQLKKFNTRLLPDTPTGATHATEPTPAPYQDHVDRRQQQNRMRRSQQELYRQKSLHEKQAQYQRKLNDRRDNFENDSRRLANANLIRDGSRDNSSDIRTMPRNPTNFSRGERTLASTRSLRFNNSAASESTTMADGDYEFVNNVGHRGQYAPADVMTTSTSPTDRYSSQVSTRRVSESGLTSDNPKISIQTASCFSNVLSELNSRFARHPSAGHTSASHTSASHTSGSHTSGSHTSGSHTSGSRSSLSHSRPPSVNHQHHGGSVTSMSRLSPGDHQQHVTHANGNAPLVNSTASSVQSDLDLGYDVPDHVRRYPTSAVSSADVRQTNGYPHQHPHYQHQHTLLDARHKRFSGDFTLTRHDRTPSHPSLSSTHQYPSSTTVRHAISTNVLARVDNPTRTNRPDPIDEQAALDAMMAELTTPVTSEQRPLSRTNSTRVRRYTALTNRSWLSSSRSQADIGRGGSINDPVPHSGTTSTSATTAVATGYGSGQSSRARNISTSSSTGSSSSTSGAAPSKPRGVRVSRTMDDMSCAPPPEVAAVNGTSRSRVDRSQKVTSISRSISSGCDNGTLSDILQKTFNLKSPRCIELRDDNEDLDELLEQAETEVFSGDITLNRVFSLKKDGRIGYSTSPDHHTCTPPTSSPPLFTTNRARITELLQEDDDDDKDTKPNDSNHDDEKKEHKQRPHNDTDHRVKFTDKDTKEVTTTKATSLMRQTRTEIISPISESNVLRLDNTTTSNDAEEYINMGTTTTTSTTITTDTGVNRDSTDYSTMRQQQQQQQQQQKKKRCAPPPPLPARNKHDYINLVDGAYVMDDGSPIPTPQRSTPDTVNTTDNVVISLTADSPYVTPDRDPALTSDDYVNSSMNSDLCDYEKRHSHLMSQEWSIDREIPRRKKFNSTGTSSYERSISSTIDNDETSKGEFSILETSPEPITTTLEMANLLSEKAPVRTEELTVHPIRSSQSAERSVISPERDTTSTERSTDRSSISSERESSVSLERAFENALENLSAGEGSDKEDDYAAAEEQQQRPEQTTYGCVLEDLIDESVQMTEDIMSMSPVKVVVVGEEETLGESSTTNTETAEDCFFPYLTTGSAAKKSPSEAEGDSGNDSSHMDRKSLDSSLGDNNNDHHHKTAIMMHAGSSYDSGSDLAGIARASTTDDDDDLDLDDLVERNDRRASPEVATLQQITATTTNQKLPRKKRKYAGARDRVHISEFQQFHSADRLEPEPETGSCNTSMSTSAISSMEGVTFIDSDDSDLVNQTSYTNGEDVDRVTDSSTTTPAPSSDRTDDNQGAPRAEWNTLLSEDHSSIVPKQEKPADHQNSNAKYVYKASASKGNSDRFDIACRKAGIVPCLTQHDDNEIVLAEHLDIKKVTLNFSIPRPLRQQLPAHLLHAHRSLQRTLKRVHVRKTYRICADGSRQLIEPPVITTTGYTSDDRVPEVVLNAISASAALDDDKQAPPPPPTTAAPPPPLPARGEETLQSIPIDVNLRYHHVKLNKNKCLASESLQRTLEDTELRLARITNRTGVKETTL